MSPIDDLLYGPDNALVHQATDPKLTPLVNLAGFGLAAWDSGSRIPDRPFLYRTLDLPFWDRNLRSLSEKLTADALIGHLRGVAIHEMGTISEANLHPFQFHPDLHLP